MRLVIQKIEQALNRKLPGVAAHKLFAPPGRIEERYSYDKDSALLSGVLLLLFPMNGEICLAFIKRPHTLRNHAGQIAFPGGKFEPSDTDLYNTALRESNEEIGVDVSLISYVGKLSELYVPVSQFCIYPFVGWVKSMPAFQISNDEVDRLIIIPLKDFFLPENRVEVERKTTLGIINVPAFSVRGEVIWGATAMILFELLEIIDEDWLNHKMSMPAQKQSFVDKSDNGAH